MKKNFFPPYFMHHILVISSDFHFQDQTTHFALAFGIESGWENVKDAMTLTVLQVFEIWILDLSTL